MRARGGPAPVGGSAVLDGRQRQVHRKGEKPFEIECGKQSLAGSVSQRACVFCGSRVVLYPVADALHLIHGPIGCAAYTWDIRGALSSGPELHRLSFCTDLREKDVVFGGEAKLRRALSDLIDRYRPEAAFVFSTCIVGLIGDDVAGACRDLEREKGIPVIPVESEGFRGTKKDGYSAACHALMRLVGTADEASPGVTSPEHAVNLLGDFNLAGEIWMIRGYLERMGVGVVANITGDGRVADIRRAHQAGLNLVQCSGSTLELARMIEERFGVPFRRVSYFGLEDMAEALYEVARFFEDPEIMRRTQALVADEIAAVYPRLQEYRQDLSGRRAAVYVGGAFKAFSLVKALRLLGMEVALVGSQTGNQEDYEELHRVAGDGTIIVDDSNPLELAAFMTEQDVDLLIGGVKERPIAYKLGVAFCDHNHERKEALEGFAGMLNFAREVHASVTTPVWSLTPRRWRRAFARPTVLSEAFAVPEVPAVPAPSPAGRSGEGPSRRGPRPEDKPATINACKVCAPLGASLAFRGVEGGLALLHGSQGCSTYIRRYLISHFREPVDIASSSFGEAAAVFGGGENLKLALDNVLDKYQPGMVGVATTCLSETIGDDVGGILREYVRERAASGRELPPIVHASTPSYVGTHMDGYWAAVRALVEGISGGGPRSQRVALFPGMVSPSDLRYLREVLEDFALDATILPDYSETMDGPALGHYEQLSPGGTPLEEMAGLGRARAAIEFGRTLGEEVSPSAFLVKRFSVERFQLGLPVGVGESDRFFETLENLTGRSIPRRHQLERGRLIDAYVDGHKYVAGRRVIIYGEEDLVVGLVAFCAEIGLVPVLVASGGESGRLMDSVARVAGSLSELPTVWEGADFDAIEQAAADLHPDLIIGSSKGLRLSRRLGVPLVRVGFPIHDRFGGPRLLHIGYRGAQQLFDRVVNALLEMKQDASPVGYAYL